MPDDFEPDEDDILPGEDFQSWSDRKDAEEQDAYGAALDEPSANDLLQDYDPHMGSL